MSKAIGEAAEKYDPDKIVVASFTRAAAKELIGRDLPIKSDQVGTLHAICYRMLGNPDIAESKTKDFNEQYPHFAVTQSDTVKMDDGLAPTDEGSGQNSGDDLLAQLGIYRARMVRKELWSPTVLDFHRAWEQYKRDCNLADFQDLIDRALDVHYPPFQAQIGIFDEVQDFTPVQLKLIRRWAKYMEWILMAGDDDQTLYSFTGATPEAFLNPPVGEEFKRVLRQSYRVPTKVLHLANRIIAKIRVREPKEYRPRDHDGKIFTSNATWKKPDNVIPVIKGYVSEGKRVMVLATCSYMLGPLIAQLRDRGIPFSNIYKANRGDWNPIRKRQTGNAGAYGRLCAYMAPQGAEFQGVRLWTPGQLESWTEPIRVDGNFQRGAKSKLREMCKTKELAPEVVLGAMLEALSEDAFDQAVSFDLEWFLSQITPAKQKAYDFPSRVYKECGLDGPEMAKMVTVGTVHCSPPDEKVLTVNGWVEIGNLDNRLHGLASYFKGTNSLLWGTTNKREGYKDFTVSKRPYSGPLITIKTEKSTTRVTPNHHLLVSFSENFFEKYVIYLMKRGDWFRVGQCVSGHRPYRSGGLGGRIATEQADAGWILKVCETKEQATVEEEKIRAKYGITGLTFEAAKSRTLSSAQLHEIHNSCIKETSKRARVLMQDFGLMEECPLITRSPLADISIKKVNTRSFFLTAAANMLDGYMEVLIPPDDFIRKGRKCSVKPTGYLASVSTKHYEGDVYSMEVLPHHYYISGGAVVHNSVKGAEADVVVLFPDISLRGAQHYAMRQGEQFEQILRQFYVGVTRTRDILVLCQGLSRGMFFDDYK